MRVKIYILTVLMITTLLSGCLVIGKNKEFPSKVVELANGNAYVYKRTVTKGTVCWLVLLTLGNLERQHDQLVFFFDLDDTLTHYGLSLDAEKAKYGFPD
ncbi:MAG: hypothetical protein P8X67_05965 [Syntrophobacterales bacterium]